MYLVCIHFSKSKESVSKRTVTRDVCESTVHAEHHHTHTFQEASVNALTSNLINQYPLQALEGLGLSKQTQRACQEFISLEEMSSAKVHSLEALSIFSPNTDVNMKQIY